MKVMIDGKEEEREIFSYETKYPNFILNKGYRGPYFAIPKLFDGEKYIRTIDGKIIIIK